jgi:hypothetical protein
MTIVATTRKGTFLGLGEGRGREPPRADKCEKTVKAGAYSTKGQYPNASSSTGLSASAPRSAPWVGISTAESTVEFEAARQLTEYAVGTQVTPGDSRRWRLAIAIPSRIVRQPAAYAGFGRNG